MGSWYSPFEMMLNDLGFWYPILLRTGVPTPRTIIINADSKLSPRDLVLLLDGERPEGIEETAERILLAMDSIGYPCFFRGGQLSDKHGWKDTCFVAQRPSTDEIMGRMGGIVEQCAMGNIGASPLLYENWVIRELIPTTPYLTFFRGEMPIVKEVRIFVRDGVVVCSHPYWPKEAITTIDEETHAALCSLSDGDREQVHSMANVISKYFRGYWSCDFLKSTAGEWYCTDMAQGEDSYHWADCPNKNTA